MAHQLDFITKPHVLVAISQIKSEGVPNDHLWNEYWIYYQEKPYPFKYVVILASEIAGTPLKSADFKSNSSTRNYIAALGFSIRFIVPDVSDVNPSFWIAASYFGGYDDQINKLPEFLRDNYWATDHYLDKGAGLAVYNKLKKIKVNDRLAIRFLARKQNTIEIGAVGTITNVNEIEKGKLSVKWDYHPFLFVGTKPSGPGAGDWWKTIIQITREEDIELIFGYAKNKKRAARLTWNDNGWIMPSGPAGKSNDRNSHEGQFHYGHEEWLFNTGKLIDGYHYAFLEPVRKHQAAYTGKSFDIWLYSINSDNKLRYWVGEIFDVEVIDSEKASEITELYDERGWLKEMENQIIASGANNQGFSGYRGIDLFNIRFKPISLRVNDPYFELPEGHPIYSAQRYTFMFLKDQHIIAESEPDDDFPFDTSEESEDDADDRPKKGIYIPAPRPVEMIYLHKELSKRLAKKLRIKFGKRNVKREHRAGYGLNRIDIVVRDGGDKIFYEIKSYTNLLTSIREAIGQLMEYSLWPNKQKAKKMVIVTQTLVTPEAMSYFKHLRDNYNLEIYYQSYDLETDVLSNEV